jgi:hypothetical protein
LNFAPVSGGEHKRGYVAVTPHFFYAYKITPISICPRLTGEEGIRDSVVGKSEISDFTEALRLDRQG